MKTMDYVKIQEIINKEIIKIARKKKKRLDVKVYEIEHLIEALDTCKCYVDLEELACYEIAREYDWKELEEEEEWK